MTLCFTLVTFHSFAILLLGVVVCAVVASALPTGKLTLSSYCMHTETLHGCIVYLQIWPNLNFCQCTTLSCLSAPDSIDCHYPNFA